MARVKWDDAAAKRIARDAAIKASKEVGEMLLTKSQKEVPHATGTLMRSGTVTVDAKSVYVSYDTPYAVSQHEDLNNKGEKVKLRHPDPRNPISSSGRKSKYLEDPLNANKKKWQKYILLSVKTALKRGRA